MTARRLSYASERNEMFCMPLVPWMARTCQSDAQDMAAAGTSITKFYSIDLLALVDANYKTGSSSDGQILWASELGVIIHWDHWFLPCGVHHR